MVRVAPLSLPSGLASGAQLLSGVGVCDEVAGFEAREQSAGPLLRFAQHIVCLVSLLTLCTCAASMLTLSTSSLPDVAHRR